jgi:cytochrome c oxidase subunit I+III
MSVSEATPIDRLERVWSRRPGLIGWVGQVNHKSLGRRFIVTAFGFFAAGGIIALLMRTQLMRPSNDLIGPETYNALFTMHGTTMMFLFAVPVLEGFALYIVPLMIGARDLPFPRLTNFGYWSFLFGGLMLYASFLAGAVPDGGWFAYPPLTGPDWSPGNAIDFWLLGVTFVEISTVTAAVELTVSVIKTRAPGMSLNRMPLFVWAILVTALVILFAFPPLMMGGTLLELDRAVGTQFYDPDAGGQPLLWQHLFWFFGHPEVYVMLLPALGIISSIVPTFARRRIVAYPLVVVALVSIGVLSFGLWVHHMFATGIPVLALSFFTAASLTIAIPSGIQVFSWLSTLLLGSIVWRTPLLWIMGFFIVFVAGGITGVMVAVVPFDWQVHDSYFVVAHFHYVLIGGVLFPLLGGVIYWFPKITGRLMSERVGTIAFWLVFAGFNLTFFPMHLVGMLGMPRRVYTYDPAFGWGDLNLIETLGSYLLAFGLLVYLGNVVWGIVRGERAGPNPWGATTLEWAVPSPPPPYNFAAIPAVAGPEPLAPGGLRDPDPALALDSAAGGRREMAATSVLDGAPQGVITLPQFSILPFLSALAVGVALAFVLVSRYVPAAIAAGVLLALVALWLWPGGPDYRRDPGEPLEVAATRGYDDAARSTVWWGVLLGLLGAAAGFAGLWFGAVYVRLDAPSWPPPGFPPPDLVWPAAMSALLLVAVAAVAWAHLGLSRGARWRGAIVLPLASLLGLAAAALPALQALPDPSAHVYGSVIVVSTVFASVLAAVPALVGFGVWLAQRTGRLVDGSSSMTAAAALTWYGCALMAITTLGVAYLLPELT